MMTLKRVHSQRELYAITYLIIQLKESSFLHWRMNSEHRGNYFNQPSSREVQGIEYPDTIVYLLSLF